jgi:4-aminobutyrate aminotransferase-like enzyme
VVKVMPPLVITDEELMAGLEIVKKSIAAVLAK